CTRLSSASPKNPSISPRTNKRMDMAPAACGVAKKTYTARNIVLETVKRYSQNVRMNSGKIIVLTGATRGLGRSLVPHFAAAGHTVLGCGRSEKHIAELRKQFGSPHDFTALDVARDKAVRSWAERLLKQFGTPDLLISNAAIMVDTAPLW